MTTIIPDLLRAAVTNIMLVLLMLAFATNMIRNFFTVLKAAFL